MIQTRISAAYYMSPAGLEKETNKRISTMEAQGYEVSDTSFKWRDNGNVSAHITFTRDTEPMSVDWSEGARALCQACSGTGGGTGTYRCTACGGSGVTGAP